MSIINNALTKSLLAGIAGVAMFCMFAPEAKVDNRPTQTKETVKEYCEDLNFDVGSLKSFGILWCNYGATVMKKKATLESEVKGEIKSIYVNTQAECVRQKGTSWEECEAKAKFATTVAITSYNHFKNYK